ncbi:hypothetical protein CS063_04745 [Sporanaerobium hydrogeniformans]|uniref:Uncharacterized protein n=1 Tax=Sporanaerobium hydrogeniformans TaxID=3072179 RepID=A0AC61DFA6_9FIRM|nr:hydrogenase maturation protease [Sporanaerobium hydrogeniformans]PHV71866.1 hypothetical protein CS063_04745 [Sporanaerobium hydrogeniformans]
MIKVFGIGNPLLGDDAIALHLLKQLAGNPLLMPYMSFFQAETDCFYALEEIEPDDFIIILDSCHFENTLGTVFYMPLDTFPSLPSLSAHSFNLLNELRIYFPQIQGFFIGIEIHEIKPSLILSPPLNELLPEIHLEVASFLHALIHNP